MQLLNKTGQAVVRKGPAGSRAVRCAAVRPADATAASRRQALQQGVMLAAGLAAWPAAAAVQQEEQKKLCDAACVSDIEAKEMVTTPSGLQYRDITVGSGPQAQVGFQAVVHYVAMLPNGRIFENSLERGTPFDIRIGTGQIVAGLDEALSTMKVGGVRRVYVPGNLSFPKPLKAAAGRPSVPANSPVVFDVQLLYIPGLDDE